MAFIRFPKEFKAPRRIRTADSRTQLSRYILVVGQVSEVMSLGFLMDNYYTLHVDILINPENR